MTALVVEGATDAALIRPLLSAAGLDEVSVRVAGGKSSALSLGPSIASARGVPVAVLVDADTTDRRALKQQRLIFFDLQSGTTPSAPCELFLAAPTLEEDLLPDADAFDTLYGVKLGARERDSFTSDHRAFLDRWVGRVGRGGGPWHGTVDPAGASDGWGNPLLRSLVSYLRLEASAQPAAR